MAPKRTREQAGLDNECEMSSDFEDEDDKPTVSDLDNDLMQELDSATMPPPSPQMPSAGLPCSNLFLL